MGALETIVMIAALLLMFAAVLAKVATTQLINRMKRVIETVNQSKQKTLGELKLAQSQKKVAQQNKSVLEKKKAKIQKKISRLKKELSTMLQEQEHRQKMRDTMRGKLVRPVLVAPQQEEGEAQGEDGGEDETPRPVNSPG